MRSDAVVRNHFIETGRIKLGCLFSLALLALFVYASYKVFPLYYHGSEFRTSVEQEVGRAAAKYIGDEALRQNILNLAEIHQIPLGKEDIQIVRASNQVAVDVKYAIEVDFVVYRHVFRFDFRARSYIGAL